MSGDKFVILPLSIVRDRTLTHRQRVALEALISFRSARSGKVYATLEDIADRCGLHPHGISTAVNELARAGYIRIKRNRRGCNDYHFLFAFHDWKPEPEDDQKATESADPKPPKTSRKTGNLDGIKTSRNPGTRLPGIRETPTDQYRPKTDTHRGARNRPRHGIACRRKCVCVFGCARKEDADADMPARRHHRAVPRSPPRAAAGCPVAMAEDERGVRPERPMGRRRAAPGS